MIPPTSSSTLAGWRLSQSYAKLPDGFHAEAEEYGFAEPKLLVFNHSLAEELGLRFEDAPKEQWAAWLSGQESPPGGGRLSMAYAGHQFGGFTMLGDGRAMLIGEQTDPDGGLWDIQLKGGGPTPFARRGDGLATLGPMLREYLISESMHALGIPTTRSLAVVTTGDQVFRQGIEPGAVLTRVARGHVRVGTMQYAAARQAPSDETDTGDLAHADQIVLMDYAIDRLQREIAHVDAPEKYEAWIRHIIDSQAKLIAQWMSVGFIHGVMNTDNMSLSGETIDYGPCAFMDRYDSETVFSSIDTGGRYAYGQQPAVGGWNLTRLAEAMIPVLASTDHRPDEPEIEQAIETVNKLLGAYPDLYNKYFQQVFSRKLGFIRVDDDITKLIDDLLELMSDNELDMTNTFASLANGAPDAALSDWMSSWKKQLASNGIKIEDAIETMSHANPRVIPRNHLVEECLAAAVRGDMDPFNELLSQLQAPYDAPLEKYTAPSPKDAPPYQTFCGT